jgi:hypothetical protein
LEKVPRHFIGERDRIVGSIVTRRTRAMIFQDRAEPNNFKIMTYWPVFWPGQS